MVMSLRAQVWSVDCPGVCNLLPQSVWMKNQNCLHLYLQNWKNLRVKMVKLSWDLEKCGSVSILKNDRVPVVEFSACCLVLKLVLQYLVACSRGPLPRNSDTDGVQVLSYYVTCLKNL